MILFDPVVSEMNRHLEREDRSSQYEEWRRLQLSFVPDPVRQLFHGELNEFLNLIRDEEFIEAAALLKRADDSYIREIETNPEF